MRLVVAGLAILLIPFASFSHHSLAYYDRSEVLELVGEISRVRWGNPHVFIGLTVDGVEWEIESQPANTLARFGLSREALQVGRQLTVAGWGASEGEPAMRLQNLLLSDGREFLTDGQARPRWSDQLLGFGVRGNDRPGQVVPPPSGIFRVWPRTIDGGRLVSTVRWPNDLPLTESAQARFSQWDRTQDPALRCVPPGMPRAMAQNPFAIQFVDSGNTIELRLEEFDQVRTIYLQGSEVAENRERTPLGYSTGRWEDENTFIVRTTAIDYSLFNQAGVPLGDSAEVTERFTLSGDQLRLDYEITVTDPDVFTEPVTGSKYWLWDPNDEIRAYNCGAG